MSTLPRWSAEYETGIEAIDRQHRRLMDLADRVACSPQEGDGGCVPVIDALLDCAIHHFADEERLMQQHALDADVVEQHVQQHRAFVDEVRAMRALADAGGDARAAQRFIGSWLTYHMLGADQAMAEHIRRIATTHDRH